MVMLSVTTARGRPPPHLKTISLPHAHKSHVGCAAALRKASGATVCSHSWEVDVIAGRRAATRVSPIPQKPLQVYKLQLGLALGLGKHVPCEVDRTLKAGDQVGRPQGSETAGHAPGRLPFWWADSRAPFAGA